MMRTWTALAALAVSAPALGAEVEAIDPPELGFYAKRIEYAGIAIKSHRAVDDRALVLARDKVARMLGSLPAVRANLAAAGAELHVIAAGQGTSDLPENRHFKGRPFEGRLTLDERTRGIGGLLSSCGEENLLGLAHDRYQGYDVCTHEFAHAIYAIGMDEATRAGFAARYAAAKAQGSWRGHFAETNADEFFAELSMLYFVDRERLAARDRQTFALIDRFYRGEVAVQPGIWHAAAGQGEPRSAQTMERARLVVRNLTPEVLLLYWLDFDGERRFYASVPPYGVALQDTYARHAWVLLDPYGKARASAVAAGPGSVVTVR